jgi:hypothetical protein
MNTQTREVRDGDLERIIERIRMADRVELLANHKDPLEALKLSVKASLWSKVLVTKLGVILCVFGLGEHEGTIGIPWMIGTVDIRHHRKDFMRVSREVVAHMGEEHTRLANITDARNTTAHRWLESLGFNIVTSPPIASKYGAPFYMFYKEQNVYIRH